VAGDPRLTRSRCASPDVHLNDEALAVAAMLLLTRSTFTETIDPNRAFDELTRALEMVALANAPFVRNIAAEIQLNSRVSRLDPEARLARADRLLISWHRAGDVPRVFNTLATIITLLDADRQSGDIVFVDEVINSHNVSPSDWGERGSRRAGRVLGVADSHRHGDEANEGKGRAATDRIGPRPRAPSINGRRPRSRPRWPRDPTC
jgi:hypothetical protein